MIKKLALISITTSIVGMITGACIGAFIYSLSPGTTFPGASQILIFAVPLCGLVGLFFLCSNSLSIANRYNELILLLQKSGKGRESSEAVSGTDELAQIDQAVRSMITRVEQAQSGQEALLANITDAVCILAADGTISYVNSAFAELWGIERQHPLGKKISEFVHSEDSALISNSLAKAPSLNSPLRFELRGNSKAAGGRYLSCSLYHQHDSRNSYLILHDSTIEKEAEQQVRSSEKQLQSILENVVCGVFVTSVQDKTIESINSAAERMIQTDRANIVRRSIDEFLVLDYPEFQPVSGKVHSGKSKLKSPVTDEKSVHYSVLPIGYPQADRLLISVADATSKEEFEKTTEKFVAMVGDELQKPLSTATMTLQNLRDEVYCPISNSAQAAIQRVNEDLTRLLRVAQSLVDYERFSSPDFKLDVRCHAVSLAMRKAISAVQAQGNSEAKGVMIAFKSSSLTAQFDMELIVQTICNILTNAVTHSPRHGTIEVSARAVDAMVSIEITDQGPGIPAEMQPMIFDRFRHIARQDSTTEGGNFSLGLSICKLIVQKHGGELGLTSETGKGSTFWFTLPAAPAGECVDENN